MKTSVSRKVKCLTLCAGVFFFPFFGDAKTPSAPVASTEGVEKVFTLKKKPKVTWGAEFGSSIDISGYDSSTFNIDAMLGYRNSYVDMLGVGAGIHRSIGIGDDYVPIYAIFRTSFTKMPRIVFMNFKAGYSFNTIGDSPTFGDVNASLGAGLNLSTGKTFKTYLLLAYEFRHFNKRHRSKFDLKAEDISLMSLSFGINF